MRQTTMQRLRFVALAAPLALALTGCGSSSDSEAGSASASASASDAVLFGSCSADDPAVSEAQVVADVDLDGDGAAEQVRLVDRSAHGACRNALVVSMSGAMSGVSLGDMRLDLASAEVIELSRTKRQLLLVDEEAHPRGGSQPHLFGHGDDGLGEVMVDGHPVLGFVATDGGAAPTTAVCTDDGGIATLSATPHEPAGDRLTWDVRQRTYALEGTAAREVTAETVTTGAVDASLRRRLPALFETDSLFSDCRVSREP